MDDRELAELYFRTTLELEDSSGVTWRITPTDSSPDSPDSLLAPYSDAFILTAENPESLDENSASENDRATAALRDELDRRGIDYRDCPGYGFDVDHVEKGFALLASPSNREDTLETALGLARKYRQNAIFQLSATGLGIIGALRSEMTALRPVSITTAGEN